MLRIQVSGAKCSVFGLWLFIVWIVKNVKIVWIIWIVVIVEFVWFVMIVQMA